MLDYETLCKEDHGLEKQLVNFRSTDQALTAYQPCDSIHQRGREGREREGGWGKERDAGGCRNVVREGLRLLLKWTGLFCCS